MWLEIDGIGVMGPSEQHRKVVAGGSRRHGVERHRQEMPGEEEGFIDELRSAPM